MKLTMLTVCAAAFSAGLVAGAAKAGPEIVLPDPGFAPEGIAADSDGALYTGSLTQGRIVRIVPETGVVTDFVAPGANGMVSTVGMHVAGDLVFACSSDPGTSALTGTAAPALVAFDRQSGEATGRYELPEGGAFCNDIAEMPDGTILATDSFAPRIYALRPGSERLDVWLEDARFAGEGFNLNGIAHDAGAIYVLRCNEGSMHRIEVAADGGAGAVSEVALPAPFRGPDGLTALGGGRFLVVEGGGLHAGARGALTGVRLDGATATIETIAADLDVPTTAVVVGDIAYVVEGQLDHLFDAAAGPPEPYRILSINLPTAYRKSRTGRNKLMPAHAIVLATPRPHKTEEAARYSNAVQTLLAAAGARPLFRGPVSATVSGTSGLVIGMVLEFPDLTAAREFFAQDAYQALVDLRDDGFAKMEIHIVE